MEVCKPRGTKVTTKGRRRLLRAGGMKGEDWDPHKWESSSSGSVGRGHGKVPLSREGEGFRAGWQGPRPDSCTPTSAVFFPGHTPIAHLSGDNISMTRSDLTCGVRRLAAEIGWSETHFAVSGARGVGHGLLVKGGELLPLCTGAVRGY
jgi:hypothetical protein